MSGGDAGYEYDANGNMIKKTVANVDTLFFYNLEDRLERVEDGSGSVIAIYGYDPFGRRILKEVSGTRTCFMYADEGLVGEYDGAGAEIKTYGWKPGGTWGTDPLFMKEGSDYFFYQNDHLGMPHKMTAVNGAVVWSANYSSFGEAFVDPASTIENHLRLPGQYWDAETGLHYNWHRYYDPGTGRYITPDPIGLAGGINPFLYAEANPVNYIDPNGLTSRRFPTYSFNSFCEYTSAGEALGGGLLVCQIDGPCENGKRKVWKTETIAVGITAGTPGGRNYFFTNFEYSGPVKNINGDGSIFEGASHIISAGGALPSFGGSYAGIKLGSTLSRGFGKQTGFDLSADAFWGNTTVIDSWTECCDE